MKKERDNRNSEYMDKLGELGIGWNDLENLKKMVSSIKITPVLSTILNWFEEEHFKDVQTRSVEV